MKPLEPIAQERLLTTDELPPVRATRAAAASADAPAAPAESPAARRARTARATRGRPASAAAQGQQARGAQARGQQMRLRLVPRRDEQTAGRMDPAVLTRALASLVAGPEQACFELVLIDDELRARERAERRAEASLLLEPTTAGLQELDGQWLALAAGPGQPARLRRLRLRGPLALLEAEDGRSEAAPVDRVRVIGRVLSIARVAEGAAPALRVVS